MNRQSAGMFLLAVRQNPACRSDETFSSRLPVAVTLASAGNFRKARFLAPHFVERSRAAKLALTFVVVGLLNWTLAAVLGQPATPPTTATKVQSSPVYGPWTSDLRLLSFDAGTNSRSPGFLVYPSRREALVSQITQLPTDIYLRAVFEVLRRPGESIEGACTRLLRILSGMEPGLTRRDLSVHPTLDADLTVTIALFKEFYSDPPGLSDFSKRGLTKEFDLRKKSTTLAEQRCGQLAAAIETKFGVVKDHYRSVWYFEESR